MDSEAGNITIGYVCSHRYTHRSGITLTSDKEVNNPDYLFIMASVSGWDIAANEHAVLKVDVLKQEIWASVRIRASLTGNKLW